MKIFYTCVRLKENISPPQVEKYLCPRTEVRRFPVPQGSLSTAARPHLLSPSSGFRRNDSALVFFQFDIATEAFNPYFRATTSFYKFQMAARSMFRMLN